MIGLSVCSGIGALGNSWAVNCGQWVFDRIKLVEGMT